MNFNELYNKIKEIDQRPVQQEGMWDTITGAAKSAGQAVANTTLGDVGNAVKNYSLPGMAANAVKSAAGAVRGAVAPAAAAKPMAPVKPADAFGGAPATPAADFGDLPPQSTAGAGRGSINPPMAGQPQPKAAAKPATPAVSGANMVASDKAFSEEYDNVEECGLPGMSNMPSGMMGTGAPKQQDNVTMNVSMNGSGAGGIRDLLNVLKDIQDGPESEPQHSHDSEHDILIGEPEESYEEDAGGGFNASTNNPDQITLDINDVINVGTPPNSGDHRPRQAGLPIGNPHMHEGLVKQLAAHYADVKGR